MISLKMHYKRSLLKQIFKPKISLVYNPKLKILKQTSLILHGKKIWKELLLLPDPNWSPIILFLEDDGIWDIFQEKQKDIEGNKFTTQRGTLRIQSQTRGSRNKKKIEGFGMN